MSKNIAVNKLTPNYSYIYPDAVGAANREKNIRAVTLPPYLRVVDCESLFGSSSSELWYLDVREIKTTKVCGLLILLKDTLTIDGRVCCQVEKPQRSHHCLYFQMNHGLGPLPFFWIIIGNFSSDAPQNFLTGRTPRARDI